MKKMEKYHKNNNKGSLNLPSIRLQRQIFEKIFFLKFETLLIILCGKYIFFNHVCRAPRSQTECNWLYFLREEISQK